MNPPKITPELRSRGVIYVRVSTDEQVNGTSLDDQERQCRAALESSQVEFVARFRDEGASAKTTNREALWQAIEFCLDKKNRIGVFMVWKVDRFARRTEDHFAIRKILQDAGIELRSATEPIGNDPSSKLFEVMVAGFAEFDNSVRRLRAVNGMRARIRSGIWPFKAPLGYRNRSLARKDLKKTEPDPVDPVIFPILQRVLKAYAKGTCTQSDMVRQLEAAGFEALTGTRPCLGFVDHLLGRQLPFYAGWLRDPLGGDETTLCKGGHTPMITDAEWRRIELIRRGGARFRLAHDRNNPTFPLRRLLTCSSCRRALTGSSPRGSHARYAYYHYFNRACPRRYKNIPKDELEDAFRALLVELTPRPAFFALLTESMIAFGDTLQATGDAAARARDARQRQLDAKRAKVFELAESGVYNASQAKERLVAIEREIAEAAFALREPSAEPLNPPEAVAKAQRAIEQAMAAWLDLEPAARAKLQKLVFPEGISYSREEGFGTPKLAPIFELNRTFAGPKAHEGDFAPGPGYGAFGTKKPRLTSRLNRSSARSRFDEVGLFEVCWNEIVRELRDWASLSGAITSPAEAV